MNTPPFKYKYFLQANPYTQSFNQSNLFSKSKHFDQKMFAGSDHHQLLQYHPPPPPPQTDRLGLMPSNANAEAIMLERKWRPPGGKVEIAPNCPRCASPNTKFCYYNNYSLSQPRYFCKGCRRYWTKGGSLRNVPVGGGCRRTRRPKSSRSSKSSYINDHRTSIPARDSYERHDSVCPNGGSDIDLAIVFAKFLNNESSSSHESTELTNASNSSTPDYAVQNELHHIHSDLAALEELPNHDHQVTLERQEEDPRRVIQDLLADDMIMNNAYGLQDLLSDEVIFDQDALWTGNCQQGEADAEPETNSNNFTWQHVPIFQLQDFDAFPADHGQSKASSANFITDHHWSSFDLSGFELSSRP